MRTRLIFVPLLLILRELQAYSTQSCPKECLCLSQIQVLCNTGNLTSLPTNFPVETQEIEITNQNIPVIPPNAFSYLKDLRRLVLNSNNISSIKPFAFKDLRNMTEISLQNNPITRLPGFSFAGMRNISNLYLGYNRLNRIDGYAFAGSEMFQMLLLNNNPIKEVNSSAFSGLKQVEFLFLPAGVQTLQSDAFNGLEQVGLLRLLYLGLRELSPYTFRGLKDVRVLSIENSDLATIKERAFQGLERVGELKIAHNKIDRIEDFSISNEVSRLTLRGNHVLEIPTPDAMENIQVSNVTVEENHFPCNCRILFLLESTLGKGSNFLRTNKCISPLNLNGRPMGDMKHMGMLRNCRRDQMLAQVKEEANRRKEKRKKQQQRRKMREHQIIESLPTESTSTREDKMTSDSKHNRACSATWIVSLSVLLLRPV